MHATAIATEPAPNVPSPAGRGARLQYSALRGEGLSCLKRQLSHYPAGASTARTIMIV